MQLQKREVSLLFWILRISCALCFIGHGAFGFIGKEAWIPFFSAFGISREYAYMLMPLIGFFDCLFGALAIFYPAPFVFIWMFIWALWTAFLRPYIGMGWWEFFERAGNYGIPLVVIFLFGLSHNWKLLFIPIRSRELNVRPVAQSIFLLQLTTFFLLLGHAGFSVVMRNELLVHHWKSLGMLPSEWLSGNFLNSIGFIEGILAIVLLFTRSSLFAFGVVVWKLVSELLYPLSGDYVWEFVERFGSYVAPFALGMLLIKTRHFHSRYFWWGQALSRVNIVVPEESDRALRISLGLLFLIGILVGNMFYPGSFSAKETGFVVSPVQTKLLVGEELLERLQKGGLTLYFRHFHTSKTPNDDLRQWEHGSLSIQDFDDCQWQRPLVNYGRQRAAQIAMSIEKLHVPVGRVYSSPYCRCVESAKLLTNGTKKIFRKLELIYRRREHTRERMETATHELLQQQPTPSGSNNIIVAHRPPMDSLGVIDEGEAYVFEPLVGGKYKLIGKIEPNEWNEALVYPEMLGRRRFEGYEKPHA